MNKYDFVLVISDLGSGGTQRVLTQMISLWLAQGKHLAVVTLAEEKNDFYTLPASVDRYSLAEIRYSTHPVIGLFANLKRIIKLRKIFKKLAPKIVIGFICTTNILTILATRGLNMRVIISERNDPAKQAFGWIWDTLRNRIYRYADVITANSQGALASLERYVPKKKLRWVPNPLLVSSENKFICFDRPSIVTVGRLHPQKAYDVLLSAFSLFQRAHPHWQLVMVGEGPLRQQLMDQARMLGIAEHVTWYGTVNDPFPYYRAAKIFALSSRHEGIPNAMLEAMSCQKPVIVSNASPGPLEYVIHNETGLVVPVEDVNALADALSQLADDPGLRDRLAAQAFKKLQQNSSENVMTIWNAILSSPIDNSSKP